MAQRFGIAGAGLMGRMLAEWLTNLGHEVTLFDRDTRAGLSSCAHTGAGMLAPWCELEHAEAIVSTLGVRSLELWPELLARLALPVFFQQEGSLVVAHPTDRPELQRLRQLVERRAPAGVMLPVDAKRIGELEPELDGRFANGLFFPREGQVDNLQLLAALEATLVERKVIWHERTEVTAVEPGRIVRGGESDRFDVAIDCRGLGGGAALASLRAVRGEIVRVHAPDVNLRRPVRLMHPRYPLYIVPRQGQLYVIGATSIESHDFSPASVRSLLELLSAAYALHSGFAEARLLSTETNCRPAFPHNCPRLHRSDGLLRVNGLYRHGFLLAPALAEGAAALLTGQALAPHLDTIITEISP